MNFNNIIGLLLIVFTSLTLGFEMKCCCFHDHPLFEQQLKEQSIDELVLKLTLPILKEWLEGKCGDMYSVVPEFAMFNALESVRDSPDIYAALEEKKSIHLKTINDALDGMATCNPGHCPIPPHLEL